MKIWKINFNKKIGKLKNPLLVEGLPGIGNVGKITVDFLIDELNAKKVAELTSHSMPNSVFINEKNLVELPLIEIYYKRINGRDILFLAGDIQPVEEVSSYEFCETILDEYKKQGGKELITLGGIGLSTIPKQPKVYCTGNNKKIIQKYKSSELNQNIYGVVGPIIGVTGLLVGLAARKKMNALCLLAETYNNPFYLGIKGARKIIEYLNKKLKLNINIKNLDKEVKDIEQEITKKAKRIAALQSKTSKKQRLDYIG